MASVRRFFPVQVKRTEKRLNKSKFVGGPVCDTFGEKGHWTKLILFPGGGETSHMKRSGMLVGKFELNL